MKAGRSSVPAVPLRPSSRGTPYSMVGHSKLRHQAALTQSKFTLTKLRLKESKLKIKTKLTIPNLPKKRSRR